MVNRQIGLPLLASMVLGAMLTQSCSCNESPNVRSDAGVDSGPHVAVCGDGILDPFETCDTAIPNGSPGACPTPASCDDGIACTDDNVDSQNGFECVATCIHNPITAPANFDSCCPSGATNANDNDCLASCGNGTVDSGESCDTGIATGPGSCAALDAACDDGVACTTDTLLSALTCTDTCMHTTITQAMAGDMCCPSGATNATDSDCSASCGNGVVDSGETCDTGIASGAGSCATSCNDSMACTTDSLMSAGTCNAMCVFTTVTTPANGDSCCPSGANANTDNDCSPTCGNGAVETGELCDTTIAAGLPGACPTTCDDATACTTDTLMSAGTCSAQCSYVAITAPTNGDTCCPAGANATNDNDCAAVCGNSVVEGGETCDTGITSGAGSCPASCNDNMACTTDTPTGSGCTAACTNTPITTPINADGCCPAGANALNDNDCSMNCGNGVVEGTESCDTGIASGAGSCPASCGDGNACTTDMLLSAGTCNATCTNTAITNPVNGDGCCPAGANMGNDSDCAVVCGDGFKSNSEACDTAIPTGMAGACPVSCNDSMACTTDTLMGAGTCAAMCTFTAITTPANGDGCCPAGANMGNDNDCGTVCGDGVVTGGEACDTGIASGAGSCPTVASCNDGVACTNDIINGTACSQVCTHTAKTAGPIADMCCPAGATLLTDPDCPVACGDGVRSPSEQCDTAIASGAGSCPTVASCNDAMACTSDTVANSGTCQAMCAHANITTPANGDGCCPSGANMTNDNDCPVVCGDGVKAASEQCDDGNNMSGDGCQYPACTPTCTADAQCDDANVCTLPSTCQAALPNGSRTCTAVMNAPNTTACTVAGGGAGLCNGMGACVASGPVCGNGMLEAGEVCDDGNATRWDGCFSCQFEQVFRVTNLTMLATTPAACTGIPHKAGTNFNVVGPALNSNTLIGRPLDLVNTSVNNSITAGTFITLVHAMDVDNTSAARLGMTDASIRMAFFTGAPNGTFNAAAGSGFIINNSTTQLTGAAADPNPNQVLAPGSVASMVYSGGSGTGAVNISVDLGTGGPISLRLYSVQTGATLANNGTRITNVTNGYICGAARAGDLDAVVPTMGDIANYCSGKSLLDVLGRGCSYIGQNVAVATQPNVDLGGDGLCATNAYNTTGANVNVCFDGTACTRNPASGTNANCAQDPTFDDAYGLAFSFTAINVVFAGTRTGP